MELLENDLIEGSSGRFGKRLIYSQRGRKTVITRRSSRKRDPNSTRQQVVRETFAEGIIYARGVIADPELKSLYQAKVKDNQTAFNLAVSDFCKAPQITRVHVFDYTGQIGDKIIVRAVDDFKVVSVELKITDSADSLIEEGTAVLSPNGADWIYLATATNPVLAGTKILVSAADLPGNVTTQEVLL